MINPTKIDWFLKDEVMSSSVYEALRDSFLKTKGQKDVQILAAERIAIDLLGEAWRDLKKYSSDIGTETQTLKQIGL